MKNRNQRIVVVGAGGVGGYFAAVLLRSGFAVSVLARGAHLEAIRNLGLKLRTAQETFVVRPEIITDEPRQIGVVDSIILAVKAWQVFDVASTLRPLLGEGTKILPLQNGIEAHTQIACALGSKHALVETCHIVSSLEAPGLIRHHGVHPTIALGELDSAKHSSCAEALAQALTDSGVNVT